MMKLIGRAVLPGRLPAVVLALTLGLTPGAHATGQAHALLTGLDFVLDFVVPVTDTLQRDKCVSAGQAFRGSVAATLAPAVILGAAGALASGALGTGVLRGAAVGAGMGTAISALAGKQLHARASGPIGYRAAVHRAVCEAYDRAEKAREPIVAELLDQVGDRCGLQSEDAQGAGDGLVRKLRRCVTDDAEAMPAARGFLEAILVANRSACLSAASAIRGLNDRYARQAERSRNDSFIPTPQMTDCSTWRSAASEWAPIWQP